jgi:hypothetical protein
MNQQLNKLKFASDGSKCDFIIMVIVVVMLLVILLYVVLNISL